MIKIYYNLEKLKPREFEILAANYAQHFAPQYEWHLTKITGDYNRDFEAIEDVFLKWGEAKHTENASTSVSKSRWDPTLLSAQLKNNVDKIFLITCGRIPLEYVVRAEHFKNNNVIQKIAYIDRYMLDRWLNNNQISFCNFGEDNLNISEAMNRIKVADKYPETCKPKVKINIYSEFSNNMLEPQIELEANVLYEINIVVFVTQDTYSLKIDIPNSFQIIDNILVRNLSTIDSEDQLLDSIIREFKLDIGYNQILIHGFFGNDSAGLPYTVCARNSNDIVIKKHDFKISSNISKPNQHVESEIIRVENLFNNCLDTGRNNKLLTRYITKNNLIRNYRNNKYINGYYYYSFNTSTSNNVKTLCQFTSQIFFNINLEDSDKKIIPMVFNSTVKYCDFLLLDIVIGAVDAIFALNAINTILMSEDNMKFLKTLHTNIPKGTMFFLEGVTNLDNTLREFMELILGIFTINSNSSIAITDLSLNNQFISDSKTTQKNTSSNSICTELLIDKIYMNAQLTKIEFINMLEQADKLYKKTDFYSALYFYDIIYKKYSKYMSYDLQHLFMYADCLNHCGSMNKSISIFKYLSEQSYTDSSNMRIILEAHTEVFNIRFWQMDTERLVSDIDNFIEAFYNVLTSSEENRDLYSYYNCLNRKMVTQYLIGDYDAAEKTYRRYINEVDIQHLNYLAFAYMDSARGLYKRNIICAQNRMDKAYNILSNLFQEGKEQRRFYDCAVEKAYIDFVIKYNKGEKPDTDKIETAILNVKKHGYRNMLLKCYLKLSSCYVALNRIDDAFQCLNFVKNNCDFEENPRVEILYNSIMGNMYSVMKRKIIHKPISEDFIEPSNTIKFNCDTHGAILLETRVW